MPTSRSNTTRILTGFVFLAAARSLSAEPVTTLTEAFTQGKVGFNARARLEEVEQAGLKNAEAFTLRSRLGFTTAPLAGFQAMLEAENIASPSPDRYSQAGVNPGGVGRAVVADAVGTEINQAWVSFNVDTTTATLGRQRLVLDNARFVGDSGWRQNMQTFDAFTLGTKAVPKLAFKYAYLYRIDRVFGDKHPQGRWDSDSHLINASYSGFGLGTLTAYSYLMDFKNAAAQSSATYGASFAGSRPVENAIQVTYRLELATQSDYGNSPLHYRADYYNAELGLAGKIGSFAAGYEVLGSDQGVSFRTPLATLHAFNGWADLFLTTPGNGLRDSYVKAGTILPAAISFLGGYHRFEADRLGAHFGAEVDLQASRKLGRWLTATIKYADYQTKTVAFPDVQKFWAQFEFAY